MRGSSAEELRWPKPAVGGSNPPRAPISMSLPTINPHVWPETGWEFVDSGGIVHTGSGFEDLVSNLRDFRLRIGQPAGQPTDEVTAQICAKNPGACRFDRGPVKAKAAMVGKFASRVVQWMMKTQRAFSSTNHKLVDKEEANRRAGICVKCPRNTSWRSGCAGCDQSSVRVGLAIRGGQESKLSGRLMGCEILAEDTRTSVFLPLKAVANPDLPENCWRKAP